MGIVIEVKYFNSFALKRVRLQGSGSDADEPIWNGSPGVPKSIQGYPVRDSNVTAGDNTWNIEEARIRGGYNNTAVDLGVRAYISEEESKASTRKNSLIYSGIYNSRTGINNTNVFSVAEEITKSADPVNGSIQKLYAEDTNLIVFQENKVSRALIDKDAIYTAEGNSSISNVNTTIGTIQPYAGEFGISTDPESFDVYGYRKYFTDKNRNAVLRLSRDGITEISTNGMYSYFRDEFNSANSPNSVMNIKGGFDIHSKQYVLSTQSGTSYNTLSFDERSTGWTSFFRYDPDQMFSLKNKFYTMKDNSLYIHYAESKEAGDGIERGKFYGNTNPEETATSVTFTFNPDVSVSKVFKTMNYEGSNGWEVSSFNSKSSSYNEGYDQTTDFGSITDIKLYDEASKIYSYEDGLYTENGVNYRAGFNKKEGKYFAVIKNNSDLRPGEIIGGSNMMGIKGYFANVTIQTDSVTNVGGHKELFAVSSDYIESFY
jgi:hypothetical protein